jgi:hypothetical protein
VAYEVKQAPDKFFTISCDRRRMTTFTVARVLAAGAALAALTACGTENAAAPGQFGGRSQRGRAQLLRLPQGPRAQDDHRTRRHAPRAGRHRRRSIIAGASAAVSRNGTEQILDEQRPHLDNLTTWKSWRAWAAQFLARHEAQREHCGLSALTGQMDRNEPALRAGIQGGVVMMLATGSSAHLKAALDSGLDRLRQPQAVG